MSEPPFKRDGFRVGVIHGPGSRMTPLRLYLKRLKYGIRQITNVWKERRGETTLIHFHVTDDGALYELVYNLSETTWTLEGIEAL